MISRCLRSQCYWFATAFNASKDYYKVLNVKQTATTQQIKKSFRTLAKQYHPDANKGNQEKFKQLNEAYQILSSDVMKKDYDDARKSQNSSAHQHTSYTTYRQNSNNRYGGRQQQYNNTYRGYQQDFSWRNRDFRQQSIHNMYQRQQQEFYRQTSSRYGDQHDETLKNRSGNFRNEHNFTQRSHEDMEREIDELFRKNAQKIKINRQSVRKAYEQEQKRRQQQYQEYRDKRNHNMAEDMKGRAYKMAEGIRDNIEGIAKVGKYVKENLDGAIKVGKFAKKLWDQYKKK